MNMRLRLTLAFGLIVLVTVLSLVLFVRFDTARQVRQFMFRGGMIGAETLVNRLESYYRQKSGWKGIENFFDQGGGPGMGHGAGMMAQRVQVADSAGHVIYDSQTDGDREPLLTNEERSQAIFLENNSGQTIGYLLVNGGMNSNNVNTIGLLDRLNQAAVRAGIVAGLLALLLALLVANRFLKPIGQLTRAAENLSAGDLDTRVPVHGSDEMATLAKTFNNMAVSLQQSEERRAAMTADIAHELRTPLSIQRAHLEALQDGIYPLTAENLQPVLDQAALLARLVEDLRTLALADAGELPLERTWVELDDLVMRVVERFRPSAQVRRINLQITPIDPAGMKMKVWGDALRLEQILSNLLSNALRFTPDGGLIQVRIALIHQQVEIEICDSGPGIPPEALEHVFERFYRADRARSRDEGGSGLGLAIARQLALAHDGRLTAANAPQGGAEFTLTLPVMMGGEVSVME